MRKVIWGVLLVLGLTMASANAASATTITTNDGVLYPECQTKSYNYEFSMPDDTDLWSVQVQALDEFGGLVVEKTLTASSAPRSGTATFRLCGKDPNGGYTIRADGYYYYDYGTGSGYEGYPIAAEAGFKMARPSSRANLRIQATRNSEVSTLKLQILSQHLDGLRGYANARYVLQYKRAGTWRTQLRGNMNRQGLATIQLGCEGSTGSVPVRLTTPTTPTVTGSVSKPVRVC